MLQEYNTSAVEAQFTDGNGIPVNGIYAVFPICKYAETGIDFVATAFFIGKYALFTTAKHVLDEHQEKLFAVTFGTDGTYYFRDLHQTCLHETADVAIGVLKSLLHTETGEPFINKVLTLTDRIPKPKEMACTYAYPKTMVDHTLKNYNFNTTWHFGKIEKYFPNGRDKVFLPNACYRTTIEISSGASGGPVADKYGRIFAINSTGIDGEQISHLHSWNTHKELRLDISNGITLCHSDNGSCHKLFHDNYGYGNNTPEQYYEFLDSYRNGVYHKG